MRKKLNLTQKIVLLVLIIIGVILGDLDMSFFRTGPPGLIPYKSTTKVSKNKKPSTGLWYKSRAGPEPPSKRNPYPIPKRITTDYITRGVGYHPAYASLESLFAPDWKEGNALPMFDVRGHWLINNTWAANFGIGVRFIPKERCEVYGANVFYDFRSTLIGHYNQVGIGFEAFGKKWSMFLNGWTPFGVTQRVGHKSVFDGYIGDFRASCEMVEYAFRGVSWEGDYRIIKAGQFRLYAEARPYYVSACDYDVSSWGIFAGIRPQMGDYLFLDLTCSYDSVWGRIFQAAVYFTLPLYPYSSVAHKRTSCDISNRLIYQRIRRFEIIMLHKYCCWQQNWED